MDAGDLGRYFRQPQGQHLDGLRRALRHRGEDRGQDLSQEGHDIAVVGDEAHLGVPGEVLGEVAGGVMRFGSKNGRRRVDPFIHPHHRLLVELGGQSPVVGMAPAEGSVVQQSRQLDLKLGPPQLKGQCPCRPSQETEVGIVQFDASRSLRHGHHLALYPQHRLRPASSPVPLSAQPLPPPPG
jgi:hypothetical protein